MKNTVYYVPAAFCACISLIALSMQIGSDSFAWKPAFYCFLPMCFVFVGIAAAQTNKEVKELRIRLAALEEKRSES